MPPNRLSLLSVSGLRVAVSGMDLLWVSVSILSDILMLYDDWLFTERGMDVLDRVAVFDSDLLYDLLLYVSLVLLRCWCWRIPADCLDLPRNSQWR